MLKQVVLKKWVDLKMVDNIPQRTPEWLHDKTFKVSGTSSWVFKKHAETNNYNLLHKFLNDRLINTASFTNLPMMFGNLFEDMLCLFVEKEKSCTVFGRELYIKGEGKYKNLSYSPDGLCLLNDKIYLIDFKCPFSRVPKPVIPWQYECQLKTGMEIISFVESSLLIEGIFRVCRLEDLNWTGKFTNINNDATKYIKPLMIGYIGIMIGGADEYNLQIEHINRDLGAETKENITKIVKLLQDGVFTSKQHACFDAEIIPNEEYQFVIPWKLFRVFYTEVPKENDFLAPCFERINQVTELIRTLHPKSAAEKTIGIREFISDSDASFEDY